MAQARGSKARVLWAPETAWDTPVGPGTWRKARFNSEGIQNQIATFVSDEIDDQRMVTNVVKGNFGPGGPMPFELSPTGMLWVFYHALGGFDSVINGAPPPEFTHTIKGAADLPEGFSLEVGFPDISSFLLYTGCRVNTLQVQHPTSGIILCTLEAQTGNETPGTSSVEPTPLTPTRDRPFTSFQTVVSKDSSAIEEANGIPKAIQTSFQINNNLFADDYRLGRRPRGSLVEGRREITGSVDLIFDNLDQYNDYVDVDAEFSLNYTLTAGDYSIDFYFPRCIYAGPSATPGVPGPGPIRHTLPWQALADDTEGTDIVMTVDTKDEQAEVLGGARS